MQFIDLKAQYQRIKPKVDAAVLKAMDDGKYIMGDEVKTLETRLAEFVGRKYCLCCSNGTDALTLSFLSLKQFNILLFITLSNHSIATSLFMTNT